MPDWPDSIPNPFIQLEREVTHKKHFEYQTELLNKHWHNWLEPVVQNTKQIGYGVN